jgi:hypothetical protein
VGAQYAEPEFVERSRTALNIASEGVRAKYGYTCSSAMDQLDRIERKAVNFLDDTSALVASSASPPEARTSASSKESGHWASRWDNKADFDNKPDRLASYRLTCGATASGAAADS